MENENRDIQVAFHKKANNIFIHVLRDFESAAGNINRKTEEYRFNQLKEQHVNTFKQQLEVAAGALLEQHQYDEQVREVSQNLQQIIKDYLHQFVLGTRTM